MSLKQFQNISEVISDIKSRGSVRSVIIFSFDDDTGVAVHLNGSIEDAQKVDYFITEMFKNQEQG